MAHPDGPSSSDILAPSREANEHVTCVHAERCGGCPLIGLSYDEQLAMKHGRFVRSAERYTTLGRTTVEPTRAAVPITQYRTRAKLIVSRGGKLGLFAKGGGHQVVDIPSCRVLAPVLADVARVLRAHIAHDETVGGPLAPFVEPRTPQRASSAAGALRAVDLREVLAESGPSVLLTLVMQRDSAPTDEALERAAVRLKAAAPSIRGVAVNFHDGASPQVLGSETRVVHGEGSTDDRIGSATHKATYGSFVQAHRGQAAHIHQTLATLLGLAPDTKRPPRLLDLYGGSGAIALALAAAGAEVHMVESFAPAAQHAELAARQAGLAVRAEASDVASALRRFAHGPRMFDAAVVNPPRRGMSPTARDLLARLDLPVIAYVSCDPDTLVRDLDHFARLGWTTNALGPVDMIPLTDEVETIALLRKGTQQTPAVIYEDDEVLVVDKGPHEPTMPQGEYTSSLFARTRLLHGASAAVPVHRLDVGTSGLVVFARHQRHVDAWASVMAHEATRRVFVAGVRSITPGKGAISRDLREDGHMQSARTRYRRLAVASGHSILRVIPEGGRTHQIRRHLAAIGHPVLGDDRYGHPPTNRFFEEKNALDRTFLHAVRLEFDHPTTGRRMLLEASMPGDLRAVLERTSGPGTLRFLENKHALGQSGAPSIMPPAPDDAHVTGETPDVDPRPTVHPEAVTDDDAHD